MNTLIVLRWIMHRRAGGNIRFTPTRAHQAIDGVSLYAVRKAFSELAEIGFLRMRDNNHYVVNIQSVFYLNAKDAVMAIEGGDL